MKKHLFLLPCMFGISAVLLTACTGRDNENTVTQEITTTQETLAAGASGSTVSAVTGAIRSFDFETHNGHSASSSASGENAALPAGSISEADAKKIALEKVPGATDSNLRIKTDYDDGIMKYEVKIVYNEMKYEFDIDAATGTILEWESESVYD